MQLQKILNLLSESNDSKFVIRKWNIVNDQSDVSYDTGKIYIYIKQVIISNLCDYNNIYILVRDDITIIGHNVTQVAFKNCTPFTKCITNTDGTTIDDAEDLDLVMLVDNLLEHSSNYCDTCSSWFYSKNDFADIANNDNGKSF